MHGWQHLKCLSFGPLFKKKKKSSVQILKSCVSLGKTFNYSEPWIPCYKLMVFFLPMNIVSLSECLDGPEEI